ncbi:DUF3667 domain-containing protein [Massilia dura]|uniref:DUF3667 domain-containing protein n=2 Tax=Pseudoduganella dura TaxID=321982 RepID=A0A6I3XL88_9BURK|nr:DUF3667 domain-containing protein [Pseudoduganella dura]
MPGPDAAGHHAADHAVPANCRNCGTAVADHYCPHCGQETRLHMPSFTEFAHEFISHYVALEGKLWGTFMRLLFRPGALTNEYLAGRRRRYVEPLRLYLTLSILFFALIKVSGVSVFSTTVDTAPAVIAGAPAARGVEKSPAERGDTLEIGASLPQELKGWPAVAHAVDRFDELGNEEKGKALSASFFRYAPYAMFCLMPLFALYLKGLYVGTGRRYGEHLLFALHVNSFAFVMFTAFAVMPDGFFKFLLFCWLLGYLPWAMRRVYRKSRWGTALRWVALMALHMLSLAAAVLVAMFLGIALAR